MKSLDLDDDRRAIIAGDGHMLVTGGPGSGKTTVALLKAQRYADRLLPEQTILFLSFSRAAVQQVRNRMRERLASRHRSRIEVSTYHLFCLRILEAHGGLLNGRTTRVLSPAEERLRRAAAPDDWEEVRKLLAWDGGLYCFDLFAPSAATLLERSACVRSLYCSRHPLIILDEFQDTDNDQWRMVQAVAQQSEIACLADPDQRIFEYQGNTDPARLQQFRDVLSPTCFDLGTQNHRSPQAGVLQFADAVLRNSPLPRVEAVRTVEVPPSSEVWASMVHAGVIWLFSQLRQLGIEDPSVAVLARTNELISRISVVLREEHTFKGQTLRPIAHEIVWDADLTAAAGQVIASVLEWSASPVREGPARTFDAIAEYYRLKNAERPSQSAAKSALAYSAAAENARASEPQRRKPARMLTKAAAQHSILTGAPVDDWLAARSVLEAAGLDEIVQTSRMVRLFRASDILASGLQDIWVRRGHYRGATDWLRRTLEQQRLLEAERPVRGAMLMNMHKSKGKEFDAVILVEAYKKPLMLRRTAEERRLLRVAITRARHRVVFLRPRGAPPLTGGSPDATR